MRLVAGLGLIACLFTGCAFEGLAFRQDHRVRIVSPNDGDRVELPLELAWEVDDFDGTFAVFFDRPPMRPNRDLLSLVGDTDPCRNDPDCPTENWLADRSTYLTDDTHLRVDRLDDLRPNRRSEDRHTATIVLLDEAGRRVGESAFTVEFIVERG